MEGGGIWGGKMARTDKGRTRENWNRNGTGKWLGQVTRGRWDGTGDKREVGWDR